MEYYNLMKVAYGGGDQWDYKGYKCSIEIEEDTDNTKAWHIVITPDGRKLEADISPYDTDQQTVNLWIDAGMPPRPQGGMGPNWEKESLHRYIASKSGQIPPVGQAPRRA